MYGLDTEAKFKVGDRVRYSGKSEEFSEPEYIGATGVVKHIRGDGLVGVSWDGHHQESPGSGHKYPDNLELALKFKVGQRVRHIRVHEAGLGTILSDDGRGYYRIQYDGEFGICTDPEDSLRPAFLPGDKVRVTKHSGYFSVGDVCEVERQADNAVFVKHGSYQRLGLPIDADALELVASQGAGTDWRLETAWDRLSEGRISINGARSEFGLPPISQPAPCIVARVVDGTPRPSNIPFVHGNVAAATTEAERLAQNNPGKEFAVYQRVAGRVAEVSYSMKEVA